MDGRRSRNGHDFRHCAGRGTGGYRLSTLTHFFFVSVRRSPKIRTSSRWSWPTYRTKKQEAKRCDPFVSEHGQGIGLSQRAQSTQQNYCRQYANGAQELAKTACIIATVAGVASHGAYPALEAADRRPGTLFAVRVCPLVLRGEAGLGAAGIQYQLGPLTRRGGQATNFLPAPDR